VPEQELEPQADGGVIGCGRVAGVVETTPWVLSWGKEAEALEPAELRARVRDQLTGALAPYQSAPGLARAKTPKSTVRPGRRQTDKRSRKVGQSFAAHRVSDRGRTGVGYARTCDAHQPSEGPDLKAPT
jgi:hypothetical protein